MPRKVVEPSGRPAASSCSGRATRCCPSWPVRDRRRPSRSSPPRWCRRFKGPGPPFEPATATTRDELGLVIVEGRRKTVQHLEGGIVGKILVAEGTRVWHKRAPHRENTENKQAPAGRARYYPQLPC
jgi:hypothetical protein